MELALRLDEEVLAISQASGWTDDEWVSAVNFAVNLASAIGLRAMPRLRGEAGLPQRRLPPELSGHELAILMEVDR